MADYDNEIHSPKRKKRTMRVKITGINDDPNLMPPVVGYFPSGYNPAKADVEPEIKVYKSKDHKSLMDVVVKPKEAPNVEFVGKSYEGEAAMHQPCDFAVGVFDKESRTLKIVPIAAGKIFRLEPRVIVNKPTAEDSPEVLGGKSKLGITDLTSLYGSKSQKTKDKKFQRLRQQANDPSAKRLLEDETLNAGISTEPPEDPKPSVVHNIPPHDLTADKPEHAYLLDEIIPKSEHPYLYDILDILRSGVADNSSSYWEDNFYPSFVSHRVYGLKEIKNEGEKKKHAFILSYITHLINFYKLTCFRRPNRNFETEATMKFKIPHPIFQKLVDLFLDPASSVLSTEKKELIIGYILVLTLFADKFSTEPTDVSKDLGFSKANLTVYFKQLGCKYQYSSFDKSLWTLPAPLQFPNVGKRKKSSRK